MRKTTAEDKAVKSTLKNDILLIVALLLVVALVATCLLLTQKKGDVVEVRVDGVLYGTYSLHTDTTVEIVTEKGSNCLVIRDGKAFVESADCPDGICAAHRPIDGTRESIVCLPHGVVISIVRTEDVSAPDLIV